jgi:hypothetical protein
MFTEADKTQIAQRGSSLPDVEAQVNNFKQGFPFVEADRAATVGDGIIRLAEAEVEKLVQGYEHSLGDKRVEKFVPASGAASRMFKALFAFLAEVESADGKSALQDAEAPIKDFFARLKDFAFYPELAAAVGGAAALQSALEQHEYGRILTAFLTEEGMNYGSLPKGLLTFHRYEGRNRTPVEEHLVEGANYAKAEDGKVRLHFTISPEHRHHFIKLLEAQGESYEQQLGVSFDTGFSEQKPSTDTIAVDMDNQPFRLDDGSLLFRPGGHGALLDNLNEIEAELIFIKNIDNVVPDRIKEETFRYKKALAGVLLNYQQKIFDYLAKLEGEASAELVAEVADFVENTLCVMPPAGFAKMSEAEKKAYLIKKLDRPVRVCGMVKNEGEPGGGPFWARNADGSVSLQIVESAQFDSDNEGQMAIMQQATHFNPVDLICLSSYYFSIQHSFQ